MVAWLFPHDGERSSVIWKDHGVKPLFLHIETSHLMQLEQKSNNLVLVSWLTGETMLDSITLVLTVFSPLTYLTENPQTGLKVN